jgi:hypothetical protein
MWSRVLKNSPSASVGCKDAFGVFGGRCFRLLNNQLFYGYPIDLFRQCAILCFGFVTNQRFGYLESAVQFRICRFKAGIFLLLGC